MKAAIASSTRMLLTSERSCSNWISTPDFQSTWIHDLRSDRLGELAQPIIIMRDRRLRNDVEMGPIKLDLLYLTILG